MGGCRAVIHTAALKRIDAVAYNPTELRKTNIVGSACVTAAATRAGVGTVIMVSSDKAVWPQNAYGVSKAAMEHEALAANTHTVPRGTRISCTRYGNVLGSTGSVLRVWADAVARGHPVPVTDPEMTRFVLTLPQAAAFVLRAVAQARGGEIFIPRLPAVRLGDLAEAAHPGYPVVYTGLRPGGEKRHEVLLTAEEEGRSVWIDDETLAVNPSLHAWRHDPPWTGDPMCAADAACSRDASRLSIEALRAMLAAVATAR
jgi:UDP-N-acetylglucosamine 4,6-dehydratase